MNERAPLPEAITQPEPGPVALIAPHPDDDVIGAGGTVALHADAGDPVHVLVFFDGRAGDADGHHDPADYVARRRAEGRAGGKHLGLERYTFWDYPEGHEPADEELIPPARRIAGWLAEVRPRTVYAPWIGEYHLDHHVVTRVVRMGLALVGFDGQAWGYEVWTPLIPTRVVDVSAVFERKRQALAEHKSQFEYHPMDHKALSLSGQRAMYCAREATHGEAFAPLGGPSPNDAALVAAVREADERARADAATPSPGSSSGPEA